MREAAGGDLRALLRLYTQLHDNPMPRIDGRIEDIWWQIMADPRHHILLGELGGEPVCSCVLVTVLNLTHGQRPYGLIENVITHRDFRRRGCATALLQRCSAMAREQGCYKLMLLTGAKTEGTLAFYRRCGFNDRDKTAFIQWL